MNNLWLKYIFKILYEILYYSYLGTIISFAFFHISFQFWVPLLVCLIILYANIHSLKKKKTMKNNITKFPVRHIVICSFFNIVCFYELDWNWYILSCIIPLLLIMLHFIRLMIENVCLETQYDMGQLQTKDYISICGIVGIGASLGLLFLYFLFPFETIYHWCHTWLIEHRKEIIEAILYFLTLWDPKMKEKKIIFPEFEEEPEYYENVGLLGIIVITIGILVLLVLIVKTLSQLCSRFANNQNNENKNTNDMDDICLTVVESLQKQQKQRHSLSSARQYYKKQIYRFRNRVHLKSTKTSNDIALELTNIEGVQHLTRIYNDTRYGYLSDENAFSKMKQVKMRRY